MNLAGFRKELSLSLLQLHSLPNIKVLVIMTKSICQIFFLKMPPE